MMRKVFLVVCLLVMAVSTANAALIDYGVWGNDVDVDANALTININPSQSWYQDADYHGGWFQFDSVSEISFSENLWTWDATPYDVFFAGIIQADVLPDMEMLRNSANNTFAGVSWQDYTLEFASIETTLNVDSGPVFAYAFWDTQSQVYNDNLYGSGGCVKICTTPSPAPVPEPATMLLFGTGLAGVLVRKNKDK